MSVSQANMWQQLSPGGSLPLARAGHSAAWSPTADGMYVYGGWNPDLYSTSLRCVLRDDMPTCQIGGDVLVQQAEHWMLTHVYDLRCWGILGWFSLLWSSGCDLSRTSHGGLVGLVCQVLCFMGLEWNVQANTWQELSPGGTSPPALDIHEAVWSPPADGMYLFGGRETNSQILSENFRCHRQTECNFFWIQVLACSAFENGVEVDQLWDR